MKRITTQSIKVLLVIILAASVSLAQDSGEIIIPLSKPGQPATLDVDVHRGAITITGTNRQDVLVRYKALERKEKSKEKTEDGLTRIASGAVDLEASEENNRVDISSSSQTKGIDLIIEVPANMNISAESYNQGNIDIKNVNGELAIENYNGKISAIGVSGSVSASTYNGDITVDFNSVKPNTPMAYNTYNGDIDITLPADTKASLKMKSTRGDVLSGFEVDITKAAPVKKTDSESGTYKVYLDDWVKGDINGGGPEFSMKNYNGDIYIRKK